MAFDLNQQQRAASEALRGNVLISAGAGSGKTRTLSERFAGALEADADERWEGAEPAEVLTITFTEKAAGELAERVRSTLRQAGKPEAAREVESAWISTIHGFCARVLRRYALEAGLDPAFSVVETVQARRLEEAAFEDAARASMETGDGSALFGDFEFAEVYDGVMRVVTALRTRGLGAGALRVETPREAVDVWREALGMIQPAGGAIAACNDPGVTMAALCERCETAAAELAELDAQALPADELARIVWRTLARVRPGNRGTKRTAEVHASLRDSVAQLVGDAAAVVAAKYTRAMASLVEDFMQKHADLKSAHGLLDFDDLQYETLRLFRARPEVAAECRALFRLAMVDEFQDTDALQMAIVHAVAGDNLCTVGDEHQSIYGFRGADIEVFRDHQARVTSAGGRSFELADNYRSHGAVLDFINRIFASPELFGSELLHLGHGRVESDPPAVPPGAPRAELVFVHKEGTASTGARLEEARRVAARFSELRDEHGLRAGDMVVLVRSYRHAEVYANALRERDFEAVVVGGSRFLTLPEVTAARALVRAIANPKDEKALLQVLASDIGRISDDGLWRLSRSETGGSRQGIWSALLDPPNGLSVTDGCRALVLRDAILRAQTRAGDVGLWETLLRAVEECGFDLVLMSRGDQGRQAFANVLKLARLAQNFEESGAGKGPAAFAAHLDAREEYREHTTPATLGDEKSRAVRIMSIHASKGLEFPVVAVVDLGSPTRGDSAIVRVRPQCSGEELAVAMRLPKVPDAKNAERPALFSALDEEAKAAEAEEGKRLFYVACTRAREVLVLSGAANFSKVPGGTECPLVWLRNSLPDLSCDIGGGPFLHQLGECPVRVEVVEIADDRAGEPSARPAEAWEPEDACEVPIQAVRPISAPSRLSYSDLSLFGECPKRFWAQRVLRLGSVSIAERGDPRRFGLAVHAALQLAVNGMPGDDRLAAIARFHELDAAEAQAVTETARSFLASRCARELAGSDVVRREWAFDVDLGTEQERLDLVGSIDAYGRTGDSGIIVDYKTGTSGDTEELAERYRLQARCYGLVALRDGCKSVRVVFCRPQVMGPDGLPQEVEYMFGTEALHELEQEVRVAHALMVAGEYPALPRWDAQVCDGCSIGGSLCEVRAPSRRAGER